MGECLSIYYFLIIRTISDNIKFQIYIKKCNSTEPYFFSFLQHRLLPSVDGHWNRRMKHWNLRTSKMSFNEEVTLYNVMDVF